MGYLVRLSVFLFSVLISLFFVWYGLKIYGESRAPSTYQTPLVKSLDNKPKPIVWKSSLKPQKFWSLTAQFKGNQWWAIQGKAQKKLAELLDEFEKGYLLININHKSAKALPQLRELFNQNELWRRTLFCSAADGILQDLRDLEAEWTYCSGQNFMTQFLGLNSLRLGGLSRISSDIFYIHLDDIKISFSLKNAINEAKRQNKLVIVGPVARPLEGYNVDGWVVDK